MQGIEPWSKQEIKQSSTCLVLFSFRIYSAITLAKHTLSCKESL